MQIFEFGKYWDTLAYGFFLTLGGTFAFFSYLGNQFIDEKKIRYINRSGFFQYSKINIFYILAFLVFVFVFTFKDISFGADSYIYVEVFKDSINNYFEPLFSFLNHIIRLITSNYTIYFFVIGFIVSLGYIHFVQNFWTNNCDFTILILVCVCFSYDMNILRSAIGCSFVFHSYCFLRNKKFKEALLFSFIGTLFHYTIGINIIFIAFYYFICRFELTPKKVLALEIFVFFITLIISLLLKEILITTRYGYYIRSANTSILGCWNIIASFGLSIFLLFCNSNKKINLGIVTGLFSFLLLIPHVILGTYRLNYYYILPRLYLWSIFFKGYFNYDRTSFVLKKILIVAIIIVYSLFFYSRRSNDIGFKYTFRFLQEVVLL